MTRKQPRSLAAIQRQFQRQLAEAKAEARRLRERVALKQQLTPLARARRRLAIVKATGGISGISTRAQQRLELKARSFLGKQARSFIKELRGVHSNPVAFVNMLAANKSLSKEAKVKAFKTYVRKHGRRKSTLD